MDKWLSKLEASAWLTHIKDILTTACVVAQCMDKEGTVACLPEGWIGRGWVGGWGGGGATMDKWLSKLESSAWLTHIKDILTTACVVAQCMDKEGTSACLGVCELGRLKWGVHLCEEGV